MTRIELPDGRRVGIRPIRASDKARMLDAFARLSPVSRYRRFFAPLPALSDRMLAYLTEIDHHDHEALVATEPGGRIVGVARYIRSPDDAGAAELAVTVIDDWQSDHLGTALVGALIQRAREEGVERFTADVLWDNRRMRELLDDIGDPVLLRRQDGVESVMVPIAGGA